MGFAATLTAEAPPLRVEADGIVRIEGTRVTLETVIAAYQDGATAEEITQSYESLDLGDVYLVIGYYLRHRSEVEEYLSQRREAADRVRHENEQRQPPGTLRERLLARRSKTQ
jgi:uncharacterized protein (DUF433 family)